MSTAASHVQPSKPRRRGFTIQELVLILIVVGMLTSMIGIAYGATAKRAERSEAVNSAKIAVLAEQLYFDSRGTFLGNGAMALQEPQLTYSAGNNGSTGAQNASVRIGSYNGRTAVGVAVRSNKQCAMAIVQEPDISRDVIWSFSVLDGSGLPACSGENALIQGGGWY